MIKKATKTSILILIMLGLAVAVFNFVSVPPLYAFTIWGTTTQWPGEVHPDWLTWLYDDWYCVGTPSNCVIVI